jgi:hypothetical protein
MRESLLLLEIVVNLQLVGISETILVLVVAVAKVMTMAGRREREAEWVVWRRSATVRIPDKSRGVASISLGSELRKS